MIHNQAQLIWAKTQNMNFDKPKVTYLGFLLYIMIITYSHIIQFNKLSIF